MRFESKEFMQSRRQWQESRESKKSIYRNSMIENAVSEDTTKAEGYARSKVASITKIYKRRDHNDCLPKGSSVSSNADDVEARNDGDSHKIEGPGEGATDANLQNPCLPADLSKRELEQLVRSKQKRKQERVSLLQEKTKKTSSYDQYSERIRNKSVEALLTARDEVKKSKREKGVESSVDMGGMLLYMLPSHVWLGDFLFESQDALNKIHKKMLLDYSRDN